MAKHFSSPLLILQDEDTVWLSVATNEIRVDEYTFSQDEFWPFAEALWDKTTYEDERFRCAYNEGVYSLSIKTSENSRVVFWLTETSVNPAIGKYMAEKGGM
jgi:hypothetical protein